MLPKVIRPQKKKKKVDEVELQILQALKKEEEPENRHMAFFRGILPSLELLDEENVLKFQCTVLQTLSDLNRQKRRKVSSRPGYSTFPTQNMHHPPLDMCMSPLYNNPILQIHKHPIIFLLHRPQLLQLQTNTNTLSCSTLVFICKFL